MAMNPRLLRPIASGFNPRSIANLFTWWDFNDLSTLAQNSNGTTPSVATSDRVAYIEDKVGNRNLTQTDNNLCGSLALANINGRNTVVMPSNAGARYDIPTGTLPNPGPFFGNAQTFFLVARYTGANNWTAGFMNRSNFFVDVAQASSNDSAFSGTTTTPTYRVNGSAVSPTVTRGALRTALGGPNSLYQYAISNVTPNTTGLGTPGVGGTTYGLAGFGTTNTFIGDFCEFLWYNRNLTATEIAAVERYLARKWGITLAPQVANADAQDWVNRVYANGGTVSTSTAAAVDTFCSAIEAAGIRDRFFRLNMFCGTGLNAALVPLYRSASLGGSPLGNTIDNNNGPFGSGDYVETGASGGLTGTGNNGINAGSSKHLRTGLRQSTLATSNLHLSAFVFGLNSVGPQQSGIVSIRDNAAPANRWWLEYRGNINAELGGGVGFGAIPAQTGNTFLAVSRESNTLLRPYVNGAQQGADITTNITASLANRTREWYICASNIDGGAVGFFPYRMGMYSIGSTMTGAQMASFNSAVTAFNSAMSRT